MIARIWRGLAERGKAQAYEKHFSGAVAPQLRALPGHRGAYLLRREEGGRVEFLAVTLWDSMDSVRAFAGPQPERAVVEPAARAALSSFDETVTHYEVV